MVAPRPSSASQQAAEAPAEGQVTALATSSDHDHSRAQTAAVQEPTTLVSFQKPNSSNDAAEQHGKNQPGRCHTEVLVAELDWGRDPSSVAPPFDVVLIADVVSKSSCGILTDLGQLSAICMVMTLSLHLNCCHITCTPGNGYMLKITLLLCLFLLCLCIPTMRLQVSYACYLTCWDTEFDAFLMAVAAYTCLCKKGRVSAAEDYVYQVAVCL